MAREFEISEIKRIVYLVKKLVEEYHRAGWENVRYNYVDKSYMESCGYWLVSIKM